jgi:glycosyltransferase involved in cell wall biosynthesis
MTITVIIPTYNSMAFLSETLDSVSRQQRTPDEVLIVDDGSTDNTVAIIEAWKIRQPFSVHMLANRFGHDSVMGRGPAGGRMTALLETQCDKVALLDHDDVWLPNHLKHLEEAFQQFPDLVLCFADALEFETGSDHEVSFLAGKHIHDCSYKTASGGLRLVTEPLLKSFLNGSYIPTAANLWDRRKGIDAGGFEPQAGTADDALFWMRLSRLGDVAYYPFAVAKKRKHRENLSRPERLLQGCWHAYYMYRMILDEADKWKLSGSERTATAERITKLEEEILYHTARSGLGEHLAARKRIGQPVAHMRYAVAALLRSARALVPQARGTSRTSRSS